MSFESASYEVVARKHTEVYSIIIRFKNSSHSDSVIHVLTPDESIAHDIIFNKFPIVPEIPVVIKEASICFNKSEWLRHCNTFTLGVHSVAINDYLNSFMLFAVQIMSYISYKESAKWQVRIQP